MIVFNIYSTEYVDSIETAVNLIEFIANNNFLDFGYYGVSESIKKKIASNDYKIPSKILSDYPLHRNGVIFFTTKDKKIILKIENKAGVINRWILFVPDKFIEELKNIARLASFFELMADQFKVFFIGGDTETVLYDLHTIEEKNEIGTYDYVKVGLDNIRQLPGFYWFTYIPYQVITNDKEFQTISQQYVLKKTSNGVFIVLNEALSKTQQRAKAIEILQIFPDGLFFEKNNPTVPEWGLSKLFLQEKFTNYLEVAIPYFDIYKLPQLLQNEFMLLAHISSDEFRIKFDSDIHSNLQGYDDFLDVFQKSVSILKKDRVNQHENLFTIRLITAAFIIGDVFCTQYNCTWMKSKNVLQSCIQISENAPKYFSPLFFICQVIFHSMNPDDFIEELFHYLK